MNTKNIDFTNTYVSINKLLDIYDSKNKKNSSKKCLTIYKNESLCFEKGELIVLASRPSIGKTALALNWVYDFAAKQNKTVGFITSGIPDSESLILRLIALESKICSAKIRSGLLSEKDIEKISDASSKISNLPIYISDIPNAKFKDIETASTEMVNKNKIEILFIDGFEYIFEIVVSKCICGEAQWAEQMELYYDEIYFLMENLKTLANKLKLPIVLLVPIKQNAYGEEPTLKSFEDKLIIPRTADKVIFLHRDQVKDVVEFQSAKLIVAKNEHGTGGDMLIRFCCRTDEIIYDDKDAK